MTVGNDQHLSGLARLVSTLTRCVRLRRDESVKTRTKITPAKPKRRSHRTTAFFEMP